MPIVSNFPSGYGNMNTNVYDTQNKKQDIFEYVDDSLAEGLAGKADASHSHDTATTSAPGFMSAEDKTKLNNIEDGAQVNIVTGVKGDSESSYRTGNINITCSNIGAATSSHAHNIATTSNSGFMSASDKSKLNGIASGAQVNTVTGVKGSSESTYRTGNISLSYANVGAAGENHVHTNATGLMSGFMSASDKTKLGEIVDYVDTKYYGGSPWSYRMWDSGLMECWYKANFTIGNMYSDGNVWYYSPSAISFPRSFLSVYDIQAVCATTYGNIIWTSFYGLTNSACTPQLLSGTKLSGNTGTLYIYLVGAYK